MFFEILFIALAGSTISMTLTKAMIFKPLRDKIKSKSDFFGDLFTCPYCMSHWVNLLLLELTQPSLLSLFPRIIIPGVNHVLVWLALVAISAYGSGLIYKALDSIE